MKDLELAIPTSIAIREKGPSDFVRRCAARAAEDSTAVADFNAKMRARKAQARAARTAIVPGRVVRA